MDSTCLRVSLLTNFEDVDDPFDWQFGTHGIHIHFEDPAYLAPAPTDSPASMSSTESSASSDTSALRNKLSNLAGASKKKVSSRSGARTLSATYLPDVASEQGWNKQETLDSAMRKAGYKWVVFSLAISLKANEAEFWRHAPFPVAALQMLSGTPSGSLAIKAASRH